LHMTGFYLWAEAVLIKSSLSAFLPSRGHLPTTLLGKVVCRGFSTALFALALALPFTFSLSRISSEESLVLSSLRERIEKGIAYETSRTLSLSVIQR